MIRKRWLTDSARAAKLWALGYLGLAAVAVVLFVLSFLSDVGSGVKQWKAESGNPVPTLERAKPSVQPLAARLAGRRLIRASEVQAAVKDNGTAQRMLGQLKLQGVVQVEGEYAAYVQVGESSVRVVKGGDRVLEFVVESVEPGSVKLSLDGVLVELKY